MSEQRSSETLGTVQRVIEVIRFFAEREDAILKDMSAALSLAPSTCHRLLDLLGRDGIIEHDSVRRRYRIGRELFRIAALVQSKHDIRAIARPYLRKIVDSFDETCVLSLYLPVEGKIFFAEKIDSSRLLRYQLPMNTPLSAFWGSSGRSILAFLSKNEVDRIYAAEKRAPGSGEPLPSRRALEKALGTIRDRGYDVTHGEKIAGAVGISAPVFGADGKVIGSLCVTIPESRFTTKNLLPLGKLLLSTAERLSVALGSLRYGGMKASA